MPEIGCHFWGWGSTPIRGLTWLDCPLSPHEPNSSLSSSSRKAGIATSAFFKPISFSEGIYFLTSGGSSSESENSIKAALTSGLWVSSLPRSTYLMSATCQPRRHSPGKDGLALYCKLWMDVLSIYLKKKTDSLANQWKPSKWNHTWPVAQRVRHETIIHLVAMQIVFEQEDILSFLLIRATPALGEDASIIFF